MQDIIDPDLSPMLLTGVVHHEHLIQTLHSRAKRFQEVKKNRKKSIKKPFSLYGLAAEIDEVYDIKLLLFFFFFLLLVGCVVLCSEIDEVYDMNYCFFLLLVGWLCCVVLCCVQK